MMKNQPHPGQALKYEMDALGLSVAQFAKALGVTSQHIYRIIKGDYGITPDMAVRLERVMGSSAEFWLCLQGNYDLARMRKHRDLKLNKLPRA